MSLRYANTVEELDAVEPMWNALQEHHSRVTPELDPQTPKRELGDAWRIRRSKYVRWLKDPETFFVLAEDRDSPLGYERHGFSQGFVVYHGKRRRRSPGG